MQRPRAVAALPTAAAAALRAQAVISGPAEAVAELVANSLDAGAREVHVELDLAPGGLALAVRDDGTGLQAADLPLLGRRHATSKTLGSSAATAVGGAQVLGYRGEALAAICEAAAEVEVTSRAAGSFETHACLLRGSTMAQHGLALEQHGRQGTTVVVRDLFAAQPVRRKALATAGLQREADRCKEAAVRLALLRPDVTFTVFDRGRKAFLLRMLRGRGEAASIAEFLGQPAEEIARVAPVSGASYAISGYAALPPHGHPSSSRQCLYLNGRWVKAPPIAKLVDSLFQPLYKANMKLQQGQGEDLQRVHKAANRHAAFVLHISCPPSEYELSHEADGAVVHLRSWEPLLGCVRHALLAAWRLALSNSLLRELERLEGGEAGGTAEAGAAAGSAAPGAGTGLHGGGQQAAEVQPASLFHEWLHSQQAAADAGMQLTLAQDRSRRMQLATEQQQQQATEAAAGAGNGGRRGVSGGSGRQRTGAKHSLASRLVRYNAVTAWPQAAAADAAVQPVGQEAAPARAEAAAAWQGQAEQWDGEPAASSWPGHATAALQGSAHVQQPLIQQQEQQQHWQRQDRQLPGLEGGANGGGSCLVLASLLSRQEPDENSWQQSLHQPPQDGDGQQWQQYKRQRHSAWQPEQPPQVPGQAASGERQQGHPWQQRLDSEEEVNRLINSWSSASQRRQEQGQQQQQEQQQQRWQDDEEEPLQGHWVQPELLTGRSNAAGCDLHAQQAALFSLPQRLQGRSSAGVAGLPLEHGAAGSCRAGDHAGTADVPPPPQQPCQEQQAERRTAAGWQQEISEQQRQQQQQQPTDHLQQSKRALFGHPAAVSPEEQALLQSLAAAPRQPQLARPRSAPGYQQHGRCVAPAREPLAADRTAACRPSAAPAQKQQRGNAAMQDGSQPAAAVLDGRALDGKRVAQPLFPQPSPEASLVDDDGSERAASCADQQTGAPALLPAPLPDFLQPDSGFLSALRPSWREPARRPHAAAAAGAARSGGASGVVQPALQEPAHKQGTTAATSGGGTRLPGRAGGPSAAAPAVATAGAVNASNSAILTLEALAAASFARLAPGMLSREQLATGRALHQVDQKFVPLLAGPLLALVDQHAADERVRLERLRDELLGPDGQPQRIASQALRTPLPLGLTDAEQQLLEAYRDRVEAWGWRWLPGLAGPLLSHAPLLWGTTLTATDLKLYLHHLHDTCGAGGMPAGVLRVLNSKACRSAVMFGDELDQGQCQALLDSLAATQLCFSCAHGRPTTAPVVNLQLLRHALQLRQAAQLPAAAGEGGGGGDAGGRVELSGLKAKLQRLQG